MEFQEIHWCNSKRINSSNEVYYFLKDIEINNKMISFCFNQPPYNRNPEIVFNVIDMKEINHNIKLFLISNTLKSYDDEPKNDFGSFSIDISEDIIFYAKLAGLT